MPTREIADCVARLRGLAETVEAVIDPSGAIAVGAFLFLAAELKAAIEDLKTHLAHPNDIKLEARDPADRVPRGGVTCGVGWPL